MPCAGRRRWRTLVLAGVLACSGSAVVQADDTTAPSLRMDSSANGALVAPAVTATDKPLPINLATALQLANVRPLDVAVAAQRIQVAAAQLEQARTLWLPTLYLG